MVPAAQLANEHQGGRGISSGNAPGIDQGDEDEKPHARGPDEMTMEDMGPQAPAGALAIERASVHVGIDVEAAVGRRVESALGKREADDDESSESGGGKRIREDSSSDMGQEKDDREAKGQDSDMELVLVDADGKEENEAKVGEGEKSQVGADAIDTSTV